MLQNRYVLIFAVLSAVSPALSGCKKRVNDSALKTNGGGGGGDAEVCRLNFDFAELSKTDPTKARRILEFLLKRAVAFDPTAPGEGAAVEVMMLKAGMVALNGGPSFSEQLASFVDGEGNLDMNRVREFTSQNRIKNVVESGKNLATILLKDWTEGEGGQGKSPEEVAKVAMRDLMDFIKGMAEGGVNDPETIEVAEAMIDGVLGSEFLRPVFGANGAIGREFGEMVTVGSLEIQALDRAVLDQMRLVVESAPEARSVQFKELEAMENHVARFAGRSLDSRAEGEIDEKAAEEQLVKKMKENMENRRKQLESKLKEGKPLTEAEVKNLMAEIERERVFDPQVRERYETMREERARRGEAPAKRVR